MEIWEDPKLEDDAMRELYEASLKGCVSTFNTLIQKDPLILSRVSLYPFTKTPLHIASLLGHLEFCEILLHNSPTLAIEVDSKGRCPLHLASANGHTEVVKALLLTYTEMCLVRDKDEMLPLHFAAMRGRVGAIKELIKAKPESIREITETDGGSVLHLCVHYNHFEALKFLVESLRADHEFLSLKDKQNNSVLHSAVKRKQNKIIKYLLSLPEMSSEINTLSREGSTTMNMLERHPSDFIGQRILTEGVETRANEVITQEPVSSATLISEQQMTPSTSTQQLQPTSSQSITVIIVQSDPPQTSETSVTNNDPPQTPALSLTNNNPPQAPTPSPSIDPPHAQLPLPSNDPEPTLPSLHQTLPPLSSNNDPPPVSQINDHEPAQPLTQQTPPPQPSNNDPPPASHMNDPEPTLTSPQQTPPSPPPSNNDPTPESQINDPEPAQPSSQHTPLPPLSNNDPPPASQINGPVQLLPVMSSNNTNEQRRQRSRWNKFEKFWRKYLLDKSNPKEIKSREQLMVAATVIATMTFQSALSPPGGVWQADTTQDGFTCHDFGLCEAGTAVVGYAWSQDFLKFIFFNTSSFFTSLCIMLVLMSGLPLENKVVMWILDTLMIAAASCMLLTYMWALGLVSPDHIYYRIRKLGYLLVGTWGTLIVLVILIQASRIGFWVWSRWHRKSSTNAALSHSSPLDLDPLHHSSLSGPLQQQ